MPLVRIATATSISPDEVQQIGDAVHAAMVETIACPEQDRFQIAHKLEVADTLCTPAYLGINYDASKLVIIQITLNEGRSTELKQNLYQAIANKIDASIGIGVNNVIINLVEVKKENWSFGNGIAQYV